MDTPSNIISEEWIRKKLNITHDNLDDIKTLALPGTYQEKITHLGCSLNKFTRLKELDLSRNSIISLEGLENLKLLEKLNLYYNNISSLKELERLKYNTSLIELDLRLNPITKEENDYRLFLINIIPSLKVLDDRSIRDAERQMANSFFNQNLNQETKLNKQNSLESNSAITARVKSVTNIAKRSAGINDDDDTDPGNYRNILNLRLYENEPKNSFEKRQARVEEYSPRTLKEIGNQESNNYNGLVLFDNHLENDLGSKELNKNKSCSMLNLRAISPDTQRSKKTKSVHFSDVESYHNLKSYRSSSDNHLNLPDESEAYANFKSRGSFTPNPYYEHEKEKSNKFSTRKSVDNEQDLIKSNEESKNQIYLLLDLVDRYWNGSKSLHKNFKFLSAATELLSNNANSDDLKNNYLNQIKILQEENRKLSQQLSQTSKKSYSNNDYENETNSKSLIAEIDNLKKKYFNLQEENKQLRKELNEKYEKQSHKDSTMETIESQNSQMKKDLEILKIKLKQYEQLQQLTSMLQESHKSLVSTNEHLLQEINNQKQVPTKSNSVRYAYSNDIDAYASPYVTNDNLVSQLMLNQHEQQPKSLIRKQFEQISNSSVNRYSYPIVK